MTLAPTTTAEEDRKSSGQRSINYLWEITQALIAVSLTFANLYAQLNKIDAPQLANSFFLVVGFYFSRTNHARIGDWKSRLDTR